MERELVMQLKLRCSSVTDGIAATCVQDECCTMFAVGAAW